MKTFIKLFALVLCLVLIIAVAISCRGKDDKPNYNDYQSKGDDTVDTGFVTGPAAETEADDASIKSAPTNEEQGWGPFLTPIS